MGIYYTDAAQLLRDAGLKVVECDGWKTRARSSGGFASAPLGIQWHHTASQTTPENDTNWQTEGSDDAPIGNATIMRDGAVWMVAAGAANTAGKGGPLKLSRGTVPLDSGNSTTWAWEVANNGVGEPWPQVQIDAYFKASIVMNKRFGNKPDDIFTHAIGTGNGWTDRKIDPATAAAVQGPWKPRSIGSSGTWNLDDCRAEIRKRAGAQPEPGPEPTPDTEDEDNMLFISRLDSNPNLIVVGDGISSRRIRADETDELTSALKNGTGPTYHDPTKADRPIIRDVNKLPKMSDDWQQVLGIETKESLEQPG
jgi:hypothetical protein